MTNLELARQQGNQAAPNIIDAAKDHEIDLDATLAEQQGNQAAPLIADSLAGTESYDAIKQQGSQAMPLIVDALEQPVPPTPTVDYMYFEAVEANSTVALTSTLTTAPNLEYSTDGETWQEWQHTTADGVHTFDTITLTAIGDRVYLRGDNPNGLGTMPEGAEMPLYSHFVMSGKIAAGGNIMSLLDKDAEMTEIPAYGFLMLFGDITEENPNTSLTSAADMQAVTRIGEYGCSFMYFGCTSLTAAAAMPAVTSIGDSGCNSMYTGCTSLTVAAAMPAVTNIGDRGCIHKYEGCTSLTAAAAMPAVTNIGFGGCNSMYTSCTSLTAAAAMPAVTNIGDSGCNSMYRGCTFAMSDDGSTLNFAFPTPPITAGETTYATAYDVANWMGNTKGFSEPVSIDYLQFTAQEANSSVSMVSTLPTAPDLEFSTDGINWQEWQHTTADDTHTFDTLMLTEVGDKVFFRGNNPNGLGAMPEGEHTPQYSHFEMTGKIAASGNIMSLLDKDAEMTEIPAYGFVGLFGDLTGGNPNTSLTSAAAMTTVTSIGNDGCANMYDSCTSLTSAAAMPVLTIIGFSGCTSMYSYCTSLTSAAAMPILTTIGSNGCRYMYYGCTFTMSDDGTTLNFAFPAPPITAEGQEFSTAYDIADWMGNTNGFTEH